MPNQSPEERRRAALRAFGKYSGMAFQLLAACLLGVLVGRWLDERVDNEKPIWAVLLTVLFMVASLFSIFRELMREN